jgi:Tol biopolymer transport system component
MYEVLSANTITQHSIGPPRSSWQRLMLVVALVLPVVVAFPSASALATGTTERVSISTTGDEGNGWSGGRAISPDGRYVAFESETSNLVPGDTNDTGDVFVRDRVTGTTERVSVDSVGNEGNGYSQNPSISSDGRYVVFESFSATNLVPGDTNNRADVFVHDRLTGVTERVSVSSSETQGNNDSTWGTISADGRYVAFSSDASNLVSGDTNGSTDAFVRDLVSGTTERVSVDSSGIQANAFAGGQGHMMISGDGTVVTFISSATNLVPGDTNGRYDVFVHDRQSGVTARVSVSTLGAQSNNDSFSARINHDGTVVAFATTASNLVAGDTNGAIDAFVHDRLSGVTERVSVSDTGAQLSGGGYNGGLSGDGRFAAFADSASPYASRVYDRNSGTSEFLSVDGSGNVGNGFSTSAVLSEDGRFAVFPSTADNLVQGDTNEAQDVFIRDRQPAPADTSPPTVTGSPDRMPNGYGWYNAPVTIDWTSEDPDPSSGPPTDPPDTIAGVEGTHTYTSDPSCDPANNCDTGELTLSIDLSDPEVVCGPAPSLVLNQPGGQVTATVEDDVSGPAAMTLTATVDTSIVGSHSASLTGEDVAGRTATVDCAYTVGYNFTGFFSPIDNQPVVNTAKAGQAIPIKWRLTDYAGNPVADTASFLSITSGSSSCSGSDPADAIETYSGSSGLQYLGDGNWQFNWKTPKSYAGMCRVMHLNLADGVSRTASFQFT